MNISKTSNIIPILVLAAVLVFQGPALAVSHDHYLEVILDGMRVG